MCMTGLDKTKASVFYKTHASSAAVMTDVSGIRMILPASEICDFEFDPCGYSMNAIEGDAISTIHVTPEDGFSYASFEASGYDFRIVNLNHLIERVLACFQPSEFSFTLHADVANKLVAATPPSSQPLQRNKRARPAVLPSPPPDLSALGMWKTPVESPSAFSYCELRGRDHYPSPKFSSAPVSSKPVSHLVYFIVASAKFNISYHNICVNSFLDKVQ